MNISNILSVYLKTITEFRRNKIGLGVVIVFPIFFFFIFGISFGEAETEITTFELGVVDEDLGIIGIEKFSTNFTNLLTSLTYENSEQQIFIINEYQDIESMETALKTRTVEIGVIIPEDFSFTLLASFNQSFYFENGQFLTFSDLGINESNPEVNSYLSLFSESFTINYNATVEIFGDPKYISYQIGKEVFSAVLKGFKTGFGEIPYTSEISIQLDSLSSKQFSIFDSIAPGLFAFSVILQMSLLGSLLAYEYEKKTINRIIISPLDSLSYLIGLTLFQLTITTIQFPFMIIGAQMFGFVPSGNYLLAYFVLLLITLAIIGFSFLIAGIVTSSDTAGITGGLISAPVGFASGAFIETPPFVIIPNFIPTLGGAMRDLELFDIIPTKHAVTALKNILQFGYGIEDVFIEISLTLLTSSIFFIIGGLFFVRRRLRRAL